MYAIANGVMVVAKDTHTFDSGDTVYRIDCANGSGGLLRVETDSATWAQLVPLDKRYDMEIDFYSVGYNIRNQLVRVSEQ